MSPRVSVVIPTLYANRWLRACLESLQRQTFSDFEVVIVDNSPDTEAKEIIAQRTGSGPHIRLIANPSNSGFAASVNLGIASGDSEYVVVLNDDTEAESQWLSALVSTFETSARELGACASLMVFASNPDVIQSAGIAMDRAAIAWDWLGGHARTSAPSTRLEIFGASAGAAMYRRAMLDAIGLFDERFFMYLEDVDLAWRAQCAGWRCALVPDAVVRHATSASSGQGSPFKQRLLGRNKIYLVAKNARLRDLLIIALYDFAAVPYAGVFRGEWHHLLGRLEALKNLPAVLRARRRGRCSAGANLPFSALVAPWNVPKRVAHLVS